ncbi:MAG: NAD-dependent epimerase/dehydratase family protein [Nitrospiraceae bacterium]|nr:NAD-dependent epimerase/dehydratase family protein [Nitrospiraceae bacterium]
MLLFIAGGTGFIGRNLVSFLRQQGINARCLVRNPQKSAPLCSGFEMVAGDLNNIPSGALDGVDMVIHLVGIIREEGRETFQSVHVNGTHNLVNESLKAGVRRFFYQSSLGASLESQSMYQKTKAMAESFVKDSGMHYIIFRPSLVLGEDDGFTRQMISLIRTAPVVPVPGNGKAKFQPLYIKDWLKCFQAVLDKSGHEDRTYEMGGPEHLEYNQMLEKYMDALGIHKKLTHMPMALVKTGVSIMGIAALVPGLKGHIPPVSAEQLELLGTDNITDIDSIRKQFGFEPLKMEDYLKEFISPQAQDR